ncbi:signal peptidase II [Caulobacter ginsengisoli]|uniref:Lipoprotein signal peptidase n=1 Tax=Caulobacter ginsengisoli TaxID=400775 RepID=A0ABU0ITM4_9CAUL|nr:signal peptidase II [Caulobacter ginsengisoli]MDQ0464775.1 signal peptidase II [Caulobacter ginsengisoli]
MSDHFDIDPTPAEPELPHLSEANAAAAAPLPERRQLAPAIYALALATIVVDQLVKLWIVDSFHLPALGSVPLLGPIHLSMVWNNGISFGLLRLDYPWMRWVLAGFALAVAAVLASWARKVERPLLAAAVGLIMGGALGNFIDRIRLGAVADFIDVTRLGFPWVFNVADSALSIGIVLLVLDAVRSELAMRQKA